MTLDIILIHEVKPKRVHMPPDLSPPRQSMCHNLDNSEGWEIVLYVHQSSNETEYYFNINLQARMFG